MQRINGINSSGKGLPSGIVLGFSIFFLGALAHETLGTLHNYLYVPFFVPLISMLLAKRILQRLT